MSNPILPQCKTFRFDVHTADCQWRNHLKKQRNAEIICPVSHEFKLKEIAA
ncbi:MAG: hypothetical protein WBH09_01600 [Rugosibacter sp.]